MLVSLLQRVQVRAYVTIFDRALHKAADCGPDYVIGCGVQRACAIHQGIDGGRDQLEGSKNCWLMYLGSDFGLWRAD